MARVLIANKWYNEVAPTGVYESYYEAMVKTQAQRMWPRFHPVHFKANVHAGLGTGVKADLALVERSYIEWWVVEVELAHHSFEGHVLPQTRQLAMARYGDEEAAKLCQSCKDLDLVKTKRMIKDFQPRVLVVVNRPCPEWVPRLAEFDGKLVVFEMFTAGGDDFLFRVNGDHPVGESDRISICSFDPLMTRWLLIDTPISFAGLPDKEFSIEYDGFATTWTRVERDGRLWLHTQGPNPLPDKWDYQLVRRGDGRLAFEAIPKGTRP
jgi:hypothetical protein